MRNGGVEKKEVLREEDFEKKERMGGELEKKCIFAGGNYYRRADEEVACFYAEEFRGTVCGHVFYQYVCADDAVFVDAYR